MSLQEYLNMTDVTCLVHGTATCFHTDPGGEGGGGGQGDRSIILPHTCVWWENTADLGWWLRETLQGELVFHFTDHYNIYFSLLFTEFQFHIWNSYQLWQMLRCFICISLTYLFTFTRCNGLISSSWIWWRKYSDVIKNLHQVYLWYHPKDNNIYIDCSSKVERVCWWIILCWQ